MDPTTAVVIVIVIIILAGVAIFGFLKYKVKTSTEIKGPFGIGIKFDGENGNEENNSTKSNSPYNVILPDTPLDNSNSLPNSLSSSEMETAQFLAEVKLRKRPGDEFTYTDEDSD